jgi:hypothetical protein
MPLDPNDYPRVDLGTPPSETPAEAKDPALFEAFFKTGTGSHLSPGVSGSSVSEHEIVKG